MERDVVLSDELEQLGCLRLVPPALPIFSTVGNNGYIPYGSIKPDIEYFVLVSGFWNGDTPFQISG